jgi:hypothetical protein
MTAETPPERQNPPDKGVRHGGRRTCPLAHLHRDGCCLGHRPGHRAAPAEGGSVIGADLAVPPDLGPDFRFVTAAGGSFYNFAKGGVVLLTKNTRLTTGRAPLSCGPAGGAAGNRTRFRKRADLRKRRRCRCHQHDLRSQSAVGAQPAMSAVVQQQLRHTGPILAQAEGTWETIGRLASRSASRTEFITSTGSRSSDQFESRSEPQPYCSSCPWWRSLSWVPQRTFI